MQLSTSFLPFDVAPATVVASAIPAAGVPAESQSVLGDFGAILASEAEISTATPSLISTAVPVETVENTSDEATAEMVAAPDSDGSIQTPANVAPVSWSGFMAPPQDDVANVEPAIALGETSCGSEIPTSAALESENAAERRSTANLPTSATIARAFAGATTAQPKSIQPTGSDFTAGVTTPFVSSATPAPDAFDEVSLDPSQQLLPARNPATSNQCTSTSSVSFTPRASASVASSTKEQRVSDTDTGDAPLFPLTDAPASAGSVPTPNDEARTTRTIATASPEQPEQLVTNDAAPTSSKQTTAANPREARTLAGATSLDEAPIVANEVTDEAIATASASVSEKRVRPLVDAVYSAPAGGPVDRPRIGDQTIGRAVAEKIAASDARRTRFEVDAASVAKKESLTIQDQSIAEHQVNLGTNVAKAEDHMPASASIAAPAPSIERLSHAIEPLSFDAALADSEGEGSAELAQVARRAVNAAMEITEQLATGEKNSVTLKFSVSGSELGVRVELRGEQVHTTFRTDSPELRAALAQEWHAVNASPATDRASRLAEPVFTSNASPGAAGSDTSGADQRGSQARQGQFASDEWARYRTASRAADTAPSAVSNPVLRAANPVAPGRLHTFA